MLAMTEHPGFLADIIEHPDADAPRLIYADWLEIEAGQPERAEFIRVQCRIAAIEATCSCRRCVELRGGGQHTNGPCAVDQERDVFPDGRSRQAFLRSRERQLDAIHRQEWIRDFIDAFRKKKGLWCVEFRRGFVACVEAPLAALREHLSGLVRRHPIEEDGVRATDRRPDQSQEGEFGWWDIGFYDGVNFHDEEDLPPEVFARLTGGWLDPEEPGWRFYATEAAAHAALSGALLAEARHRAGLPDLPPARAAR